MNKPRLIILSDIFGSSEEMKEYEKSLSPYFEIMTHDSRELAGVNELPQSEVHSGFVNGGIESAVTELGKLNFQPDVVIGFSVGGTIAWKYALENSISALYLISATRLRNEIAKPKSAIHLFFGALEEHGPVSDWFRKMMLAPVVVKSLGHECYKDKDVIERVCRQIKDNFGH